MVRCFLFRWVNRSDCCEAFRITSDTPKVTRPLVNFDLKISCIIPIMYGNLSSILFFNGTKNCTVQEV